MASRPPAEIDAQAARYAALRALAAQQLTSLWPRVDFTSDRAADAVTALYRAVVAQFGSMAATLAADFYDERRAEKGLRRRYRATVAEPVDPDRVGRIVTSAFLGDPEPLDVGQRRRVSHVRTSELPVEQRVPARLDQSLSRLVMEPGRATVARNVDADPSGATWIRVPTGETTCEFCIMLASRELGRRFGGYSSRERALFDENGDKFHTNCDCEAVAVFPGDDVHQLSPNLRRYKKIYEKGAANAGTRADTKRILAEMRKVIRADTSPTNPPANTPPTPTPPPVPIPAPSVDPLAGVRMKADPAFDITGDLAVTNVFHGTGNEWAVNCTRTTTAVELRARGYDVAAGPRPATVNDNGLASTLARWTTPDGVVAGGGSANVNGAAWPKAGDPIGMGASAAGSRVFHAVSSQLKGRADIEAAATDWGPGSRGYVVLVWKGGASAHIFNVVNDGGAVRFIDGQVNDADVAEYFERASPSRPAYVVRVDDLTPTKRVLEWVHDTTDEERRIGARRPRTPNPAVVRAAAKALGFGLSDTTQFTRGVDDSIDDKPLLSLAQYGGGDTSTIRRKYYDAYVAGYQWHQAWLSSP